MIFRRVFIFLVICFSSSPVEAACLTGGGSAGQNPPYHYVVAVINGLVAADSGLTRIHTVARQAKPADDYATALTGFTLLLRDYELAARDFDCAVVSVRTQERFSANAKDEIAQSQAELARNAATIARLNYEKLAHNTRETASLFVSKMKESVDDVAFAKRMAEISADLQDLPREIAFLTPDTINILVDSKPDASNRLSRLSINARERDDLVNMIDLSFGDRAKRDVKGDRPALEAAAAMMRKWLTTSGHAPSP
jgi:hypothetical protein